MQKVSKIALLFVLNNEAKACTDTNCKTCTTPALCTVCKDAYGMNATGVCTLVAAAFCKADATGGVCATCDTGYTKTSMKATTTVGAYDYCKANGSSFLKASMMILAVLGSMTAL